MMQHKVALVTGAVPLELPAIQPPAVEGGSGQARLDGLRAIQTVSSPPA